MQKQYESKKRISIYQQYQNNYTISPSLLDTTLKKEKYTLQDIFSVQNIPSKIY